ncbi:SAY domain-containing 1 [Sigmodon hispidus]
MEQRLAEFREARKRAGLVVQPSTASQGEQTSAAKAEPAAATSETAPGWLRRFLKWKASPAITRARPNQAQEAAQQPPESSTVPLPSSRRQSLLTNITFLKGLGVLRRREKGRRVPTLCSTLAVKPSRAP